MRLKQTKLKQKYSRRKIYVISKEEKEKENMSEILKKKNKHKNSGSTISYPGVVICLVLNSSLFQWTLNGMSHLVCAYRFHHCVWNILTMLTNGTIWSLLSVGRVVWSLLIQRGLSRLRLRLRLRILWELTRTYYRLSTTYRLI